MPTPRFVLQPMPAMPPAISPGTHLYRSTRQGAVQAALALFAAGVQHINLYVDGIQSPALRRERYRPGIDLAAAVATDLEIADQLAAARLVEKRAGPRGKRKQELHALLVQILPELAGIDDPRVLATEVINRIRPYLK